MTKEYDPTHSMIARLEEQNELLRFALEAGVKMRRAQADHYCFANRDSLIALKVAEADFDKAAKADMDGTA